MGNEDVKGFTFFRSWWEALEDQEETVQFEVLKAIPKYVFNGSWDTDSLSPMAKMFLISHRPTFDSGIKKSLAGKAGGEKSKRPKANGTADKHPDKHTDKHTDKHPDKHPDKHTDKHPDKHTDNGEERNGMEWIRRGLHPPTPHRGNAWWRC